MGILMHSVPNLCTLEIPYSDLWIDLMRRVFNQSLLLNLKELAFTCDISLLPWDAIFGLPRLKSVFLFDITGYFTDRDDPEQWGDFYNPEDYPRYLRKAKALVESYRDESGLNDIEHLEFRQARMNFSSVLDIIASCRVRVKNYNLRMPI